MASQFGGILVSRPSGGGSQFGGTKEGDTLEPIGYRDGMPVYALDVYPRPAEPVFEGTDQQGKPIMGIPPAPAKPPLPAGLGGEPEHVARNIDPRTGEYIQTPAIGTVPFLDAPFTGTMEAVGGLDRIRHAQSGRDVAGGTSQIIRGGLEAASPFALPFGMAAAPIATAITLGTGMGLTHGSEATLNAIGVPQEYSALGSDLIGLFGAGWAHAKLRGLANLPYLREGNEIQMRLQEAVRRAQDPQASPMDRAAAKAQADALMQRLQEVEGRQPGGSAYVPAGSQAYTAAQEVKEQGRKYGVRLSAGDISQKPTLKNIEVSAEKIPGIGMEGFREKQQIEAKAAAGNLRSQYEDALINAEPSALDALRNAAEGGDERARNVLEKMTQAGNDPDRTIQASIGLGDWTTRQKATELYDKVQNLAEKHNLGDVPLNTTGKAIGSSLEQLRPAKLPNKEVIRLLQEVKTSISPKLDSEGNPLLDPEGNPVSPNNTYALIRQLHSDLGERIREYYQGNNALIGEKGVGYLERVNNALEDDMRNYAQNSGVPEIVEAGKIADEYYKSARVPYKNGMLAAAATSNEPDQIFQQFVKAGKGNRAQNFYSALDDRGKAAVRYNMVAKAVDDAINPQSGIFSPQKFFTAVDKLDEAYGVFFTAKDKAEIQGFKNLMGHVTRAGQYAENPPTGQRVIPYLVAGGAASAIPAAVNHPFMAGGGLAVIAAARGLLTTVKGRDLLLRLNGVKPRSPLMESLWQRIGKEMLQFTKPPGPPQNPNMPAGGGTPAGQQPPAPGYTRMYHGGVDAPIDGPRWFTSDPRYAQGYANKTGGVVHYVDIPTDHPLIEPGWPDQSIAQGFHQNVELPAEIATRAKVMPSPAGGGGIGQTGDPWRDMIPGAENTPGINPQQVPDPGEGEVWFHGRRGPASFSGDRPSFFTREREGAEWYSKERGARDAEPTVGQYSLSIRKPAHLRDLLRAVEKSGATDEDIRSSSQYEGGNPSDYLYVPKVREQLRKDGFDGYVGWDPLENGDIQIAVPLSDSQIKPAGGSPLGQTIKEGLQKVWKEEEGSLKIPDMKKMIDWAASRIGQGTVDPAALRQEIVNQFKGIPRGAVPEIAGRARDLELKNVKEWKPGMPLNDIHPLAPATIPKAGKLIEKEDVIRYLDNQVKKHAGPVELDAPDKVKLNRLLKFGRKEMTDQLSLPDPKLDFYLVDTPQADADMIQMFPELGTTPEKMTLLKAASAALAQGSNPESEALNGGRAYAYYRKHGKLPGVQPDDGIPGQNPGKEWSTTSGSDPIIKLQGFVDSFKSRQDPTGLLGLERILTGRFPVGYLKHFNKNIEGSAGDIVPGALILGPKIGSYFLDIAGIPQKGATVDMWDSLGQYRRLGNLYAPNGKPFTAPRGPDRPIFMDLHRMLENEFGLIRTQSQSGLWHYEKDLYRRLGAPTLVKGRSDGTKRLLDAWGHQRQNVITRKNAPPPPSRETYTPPQIP